MKGRLLHYHFLSLSVLKIHLAPDEKTQVEFMYVYSDYSDSTAFVEKIYLQFIFQRHTNAKQRCILLGGSKIQQHGEKITRYAEF